MGGWGAGGRWGGGAQTLLFIILIKRFCRQASVLPGGSISFYVTERCPGTQNQKITITLEEQQRALVTAAVRTVIAFCISFDMRVPSTHCVLG